jgi:hypothetical protein
MALVIWPKFCDNGGIEGPPYALRFDFERIVQSDTARERTRCLREMATHEKVLGDDGCDGCGGCLQDAMRQAVRLDAI